VAGQLRSQPNERIRANTQSTPAANAMAARVEVEGRILQVAPNPRGEFGRVQVPRSAVVRALVPFPSAAPNELIGVQAEDGGMLQGEASKGTVTVDAERRAAILFQAAAGDGLYRITLRRGGENRVLEFWVGPQPPVVVRIKPVGAGGT